MSYKLLLGMNFLNQMVSVYCKHYTLFVYIKCLIHFTYFGNFSFNFHEEGVVDRDDEISRLRFSSWEELCL